MHCLLLPWSGREPSPAARWHPTTVEYAEGRPAYDLRELAFPRVDFIMSDDPHLGKAFVEGHGGRRHLLKGRRRAALHCPSIISRGIAARRARTQRIAGGIGMPAILGGKRKLAASTAVTRVAGFASGGRRSTSRSKRPPRRSARPISENISLCAAGLLCVVRSRAALFPGYIARSRKWYPPVDSERQLTASWSDPEEVAYRDGIAFSSLAPTVGLLVTIVRSSAPCTDDIRTLLRIRVENIEK